MKCEECDAQPASVRCEECEERLCPECDAHLHRKGKRQTHTRTSLCVSCSAKATHFCGGCQVSICGQCRSDHLKHNPEALQTKKRVAVFWDLTTAKPEDAEETVLAVAQIRKMCGPATNIRAYGEAGKSVSEALAALNVTTVVKAGLREGETMLLDLTTSTPKEITDILVISGLAVASRNFYAELAAALPGVTLTVSCTCLPLNPKAPAELELAQEAKKLPARNVSIDMHQVVVLEAVPLYQRFYRKQGQEDVHDSLMALLRSFAIEGQLMMDLNILISALQQATMLTPDQAHAVIRSAETLGIVHLILRQFGILRNNVTLCSMKLDSLSLEALTWVLRSLKRDEMIPTERAIQSRIKEAFDFKPSTVQWNNLLEAVRGRARDGHHHSSSAPSEKPQTQPSVFGISFEDDPLRPIPVFEVEEISDPVTGQETSVIYPKDETWDALDQHIKSGDVLDIKQTDEWRVFKQFLENYFIGDRIGKKRAWKRQEDETKAIPGGRYGCAQFLKTCGPPQLQQCSLGRLSYMVQVAINDDLLRYQRTLLIWTSTSQKRSIDEENVSKLKSIQKAIWRVLVESKTGVSLAQLPQHVKKYVSIDLNELGFAKLKDLLATMPEVKIELHGTNHPFAVLKPEESFDKELEDVLVCISDISREMPNGVPVQSLERMTVSRLGRTVDWRKMGCQNLMEFVRKWGKSLFSIVRGSEESYILKSSGENKPLSFSRDMIPQSAKQIHTHSQSVTFAGNHIHQHSGSLFYSLNPLERIVKTSDLPLEFQGSHQLTLSGVSELEDNELAQEKYLDGMIEEEEGNRISEALHGYDPPHYRTESVEYHSNNPSIGRHEWKKLANMIPVAPVFHVKTTSESFENGVLPEHTRFPGSYTPVYRIDPPPGF